MNRIAITLVGIVLSLTACRSGGTRSVYSGHGLALERISEDSAILRAGLEQAIELVPVAGAQLGYGRHELLDGPLRMILRTEEERAFFSLLGQQVRHREAQVRLRSERGRTVIQVQGSLIHGPEGGPYQRKPLDGAEWYDDFFAAVSVELDRKILKASYAIPRE